MKEIGTLTYACPSADDLILLNEQLKTIKSAFQDKLPTVEGLVIRPACSGWPSTPDQEEVCSYQGKNEALKM